MTDENEPGAGTAAAAERVNFDRTALGVILRWGGEALWVRHLAPPRAFRIGERATDGVVPAEVLGSARCDLVTLDARRRVWLRVPSGALGARVLRPAPRALAPAERFELTVGCAVVIELGALSVELSLEERAAAPSRHFAIDRRFAPFAAAATLAAFGFLFGSARSTPTSPDARETERQELVRYYLLRAADVDTAREAEPATSSAGRSDAGAARFASAGPDTHAQPSQQAAEFGMIGLLAEGASGADGYDESLAGGRRPADPGPSLPFNPPTDPRLDPLSTFALDVDTGSYAFARKRLLQRRLPAAEAVRVEEFVNYFAYGYAAPADGEALVAHVDGAPSPFDAGHYLVRVGVQAARPTKARRAPVHLVYLVDTSGSMAAPDKLQLAQASLHLLTGALRPDDTVALCTYAGSVREVLPPTPARDRGRILDAIDSLGASGSTAMHSGIALAYELARRTLVRGHVNRVVVLSDGDANVGDTSPEGILATIRRYAQLGITLSTVGFGDGNYRDEMMERLADAGDGNYTYVDGEAEARRAFVDELDGTLRVVARDAKVQVEFDPGEVASYRLVGYENRAVADRDFRNDAVDGGEVGEGHSATAFYDVVFAETRVARAGPWLTVHMRYKPPLGSEVASEHTLSVGREVLADSLADTSSDFRFALATASLAEVLRHSPYAKNVDLALVERLAVGATDGSPARAELATLAGVARDLVARARAGR